MVICAIKKCPSAVRAGLSIVSDVPEATDAVSESTKAASAVLRLKKTPSQPALDAPTSTATDRTTVADLKNLFMVRQQVDAAVRPRTNARA